MSPIPWNETKPVANFALGMQGASRVENGNVISRRSSNSSDFDNNRNIHITSSNDDLVSVKSSVSRGSKRLVPLSHPAVDVPLCMECQVDNYLILTYCAFSLKNTSTRIDNISLPFLIQMLFRRWNRHSLTLAA